MMYSSEQIREAFKKNSLYIREIVSSIELNDLTNDISTSHNLTPSQKDSLGTIISCVILKLQDIDTLIPEIKNNLVVENDIAESLSNEIHKKIVDSLEKIHGQIEANELLEEGKYENETSNSSDTLLLITQIKEVIFNNQKNIPEPLKNLSEIKRNFITKSGWQNIVNDISKKYSLTQTQFDSLLDEVILVLIELSTIEKFKINISSLLAIQITEDLTNRVFKNLNKESEKSPTPEIKKIVPESERGMALEERPEMVLMVEKGESAHDSKPAISVLHSQAQLGTNINAEVRKIDVAKISPVYIAQHAPVTPPPQTPPSIGANNSDKPRFTIRSRVPENLPSQPGDMTQSIDKNIGVNDDVGIEPNPNFVPSHITYMSEGSGATIQKDTTPKVDPLEAKRREIEMSASSINDIPKADPLLHPTSEIQPNQSFGITKENSPVVPQVQNEKPAEQPRAGYVDPYREAI